MVYKRACPVTQKEVEIIQEVRQLSHALDRMLRERMEHEAAEEPVLRMPGRPDVLLRLIDPSDLAFIASTNRSRLWGAKRIRVRMFLSQVRAMSRELVNARKEASLALNPEFWEQDMLASMAIIGLRVCAGIYLVTPGAAVGFTRHLVKYLPSTAEGLAS